MNVIIFCLSFFLITKVYSQDFATIKHKTDSIWKIKIKTKQRNFKSEYDSITYRVWYEKKSGAVVKIIERHCPTPNSLTNMWIYTYHFRQGQIILISRWNNTNLKHPQRQNALYYFEDDRLLYRDELKTSISEINGEVIKAKKLLAQFSHL